MLKTNVEEGIVEVLYFIYAQHEDNVYNVYRSRADCRLRTANRPIELKEAKICPKSAFLRGLRKHTKDQ